MWKCVTPGGLVKAVKIVSADLSGPRAEQEHRALQLIRAIRHPFLLSVERFEVLENQLVIVTELADRSLNDLLEQYRRAGRPGIPREELLRYMEETAEALDLVGHQHGLQHLASRR